MGSRVFSELLDKVIGGARAGRVVRIPREVEREIEDYFEECSLGRCTPSYTPEEYSVEEALKDYINFIYCALLLQYTSSMNIEIDEFMNDFLRLKSCVSSVIQSRCPDPLLKSSLREFDEGFLINYQELAECIYINYEGAANNIMKNYRRENRHLRGCDIDLSFRENTSNNKRIAILCLWTLFSHLKAVKLTKSRGIPKEHTSIYQ